MIVADFRVTCRGWKRRLVAFVCVGIFSFNSGLNRFESSCLFSILVAILASFPDVSKHFCLLFAAFFHVGICNITQQLPLLVEMIHTILAFLLSVYPTHPSSLSHNM